MRIRWWDGGLVGGFFLSGWRQELGWGVSWSYLRIEVQREGRSCWVGFRVSRAREELVVTEEGKVVK